MQKKGPFLFHCGSCRGLSCWDESPGIQESTSSQPANVTQYCVPIKSPIIFYVVYEKKTDPFFFFNPTPTVTPSCLSPLLCPIVFCTDLHFVGWKFEMVFLLSVVESSKIHHSVLTIPPFISLSLIQFKLIEKCLTDAKSSSK